MLCWWCLPLPIVSSSAVTQSHVLNMTACFIRACASVAGLRVECCHGVWSGCPACLWLCVQFRYVQNRALVSGDHTPPSSHWLWFHQSASRWRPSPSKPIGWTDAKHRRKFRFLLCLKTLAILWFRTHLDATAFLLDYISRQPRLYQFAHIWSAVFLIIIISSNVTYAGIYHWRVHIYSMGHSNLLECKCAHVIIFFIF